MIKWNNEPIIDWDKGRFQKLLQGIGVVCLISYAIFSHRAFAHRTFQTQTNLIDTVCPQIPFLVDSLCFIMDESQTLDGFLDELEQLLLGKDTVVKILHIGDSHIQAGFHSGQVMRMLQETFGNAGRGWIAPLKLTKVNEPFDYFIQSPAIKDWVVSRCIQQDPLYPWGPGGLAIQTTSNAVDFNVRMSPKRGAGYAFNEVHMFRNKNAVPMLPGTHYEDIETTWGTEIDGLDVVIDTFRIAAQIDSLHLYTVSQKDSLDVDDEIWTTANRYYGFSLMNGNPGVLYHSIGHNGAMFMNYTNRDFIHQLSLFEPSLLIVSLGTNEAFGAKFRSDEFEGQLDQCIQRIREYMPNAAILLTTPADCYRRVPKKGYQRNENIEKVAGVIREYARKEGLACFDLYEMTGGQNSCVKWHQSSFYGKDRIHFTIRGYEEQGKLLYKALIRSKIEHQNALMSE